MDKFTDEYGENVNWEVVMQMVADGSAVELTGDALYEEYNNRILNW